MPLLTRPGRNRVVRSFMLREGRLTSGQQHALDEHWPTYGLVPEEVLDFRAVFGRLAPVTLEIGFGNGDNLLAMAVAEPQADFLGVEVHRPGVGRLLLGAVEAGLSNLKVIRADVVEVLREHVAPSAFARVLILFPDPWPKRRHHKRRLVTPPVIAMLAGRMCSGGMLHLATDWREYADSMRTVVAGSGQFEPVSNGRRPAWRPETRFEARGREAGRETVNLLYRRI